MSRQRDTDKAIRNLMHWAERPEWALEQISVFNAHLAPVGEGLGYSQDELDRELAEHGYGGMLFGILFEDFISRDPAPDGKNIIDDYLKHRGWRESVHGRGYLRLLRNSALSLYEVAGVSRGFHCDVRDLVRGGEPVRVHEHMGTQNLVQWDRIAARMLKLDGKYIFSGGILPYPQEAAQSLLKALHDTRKKLTKTLSRVADKQAMPPEALDRLLLQEACTAFTRIWLTHNLELLRAPLPKMVNSDSEELVLTESRFPYDWANRNDIIERLAAASEWERDPTGEPIWTWLPKYQGAGKLPEQSVSIQSFHKGQPPMGGTLELLPKTLMFTTNSLERTERGKEILTAFLHDLVGPPLTKIQTPEQLMAESGPDRVAVSAKRTAVTIDPEISAGVVRDFLDQHYRHCLAASRSSNGLSIWKTTKCAAPLAQDLNPMTSAGCGRN
ncbi:MAG: hypothetical protein HW386_1688 [Gammaproteobacteria bacterium]|nr:hypothetical protein [Gammaproteobacteria bacterium]